MYGLYKLYRCLWVVGATVRTYHHHHHIQKDQDMIEVTGATGNRYMINENDFTIPNFFRLMAQMIQQECVRKKHITTTTYMLTSYKNLSQTIYIIHHHTYVKRYWVVRWCNGQKDHVVSPPHTKR